MTAATTGGTIPRAADPLCGSSRSFRIFRLRPRTGHGTGMAAAPHTACNRPCAHRPATAGKRFVGTRIFPAMTHLYKNFFLLHNFLDLQMGPSFRHAGRPPYLCLPQAQPRRAPLQSNPWARRVFLSLSPPRLPLSRPLRHAAERAMIPDLPGNAAPARPVPGSMSVMPPARHAITGHPVPARPASGNDASFQPCTAMKNSCSPRVFLPILLLLALALSACQFSSSAPSKAPGSQARHAHGASSSPWPWPSAAPMPA